MAKKITTSKPAASISRAANKPAAAAPMMATASVPKPAAMALPGAAASKGRQVSRALIAKRAYEIWEAKGKPAGQDLTNWQQAERELGA
ncbi:MAG: DUF2934 domain-containing protein [Phycisphaeraceae bacterium]